MVAVLCVKSGLRSGPGFIDALMWWCPSCASVPLEKSGSSWWRGQAHQLLVSPSAPNCLQSFLFLHLECSLWVLVTESCRLAFVSSSLYYPCAHTLGEQKKGLGRAAGVV